MFSERFKDLAAAVSSSYYSTKDAQIDETKALHLFFSMIARSSAQQGIVYVIGNGGSAGIASHFSTDLMKALHIPSQTLYDSNLMTCLSNDLGYENIFSYPLKKLIKPQDLLIAISSSGASANILNAAEVAQKRGTPIITLSGFTATNQLRSLGDLNCWVDRCDYGLVETAHFFLLHTVIDLWIKNPSTAAAYA